MPFVKRRTVNLLNKLVLSFQLNRGIGKGKPNSSHLPRSPYKRDEKMTGLFQIICFVK